MLKSLGKKFSKNPFKLFLIDGLGACLSLSLYFFVVIPWVGYFGMPVHKIYMLAILAAAYAVFSLTCYFLKVEKWQLFMKTIALANVLHSLITLVLIVAYWNQLSILGLLYFFGEILIVTALAGIEWKTSVH